MIRFDRCQEVKPYILAVSAYRLPNGVGIIVWPPPPPPTYPPTVAPPNFVVVVVPMQYREKALQSANEAIYHYI